MAENSNKEKEEQPVKKKTVSSHSKYVNSKVTLNRKAFESHNSNLTLKDLKYATDEVLRKSQNALTSGKDDLGTQSVGMSITTAKTGYEVAKAYSKTVEVTESLVGKTVSSTISTGKNVYNGGKKVYDGTKTVLSGAVLSTYTIAKSYSINKANNTFPVSKEAVSTFKATAISTGLANHKIYKSIEATTQAVKDGVKNTANSVKSGINVVKKSVNTVKGVADGSIPIKTISHAVGSKIVKGVKTTAKGSLSATKFLIPYAGGLFKFGGRFGTKIVKTGVKTGVKTSLKTGLSLADALGNTDDMALQGVSASIQTADVTLRLSRGALKTSVTVGKNVGKTGIKTTKTVAKGVQGVWESYKKTNSLMQMLQYAGKKSTKAVAVAFKNAGNSIVNMILNLAKTAGKKAVVPIIIIILILCGGNMIVTVPSTVAGSLFSGIFGTKDDTTGDETEFEVGNYLRAEIPTYSDSTRTEISDNMTNDLKANGGSYDLVRLTEVGGGSGVIDTTYDGVSSIFYTDTEIVDILEPIFNMKMVIDYDMSPKASQAKKTLEDLYNEMFEIVTVDTTEYCGQDLITGTGTPLLPCSDTSLIHANSDCPNPNRGIHSSYTDIHCDGNYYTCKGHKGSVKCGKNEHTHNDSCFYFNWCSGAFGIPCDKPSEDLEKCTDPNHPNQYQLDVNDAYYVLWCTDCDKPAVNYYKCTNPLHRNQHRVYRHDEHTHEEWNNASDSGCYNTSYHTNDVCVNGTWGMSNPCSDCDTTSYCNGYSYCNGHKVRSYTFNLDGIYGILKKEIYDPIAELENKASTTPLDDDEKEKLNNLYDSKEIYEVMAQDVFSGSFGGGLTKESLKTVTWHDNGRTGNNDVVNLAVAQSGSAGGSTVHGETYWSYMGYSSRISWSGCFVHWCMRNSTASSFWGNPSNYSSPSKLANSLTLSSDVQNAGAGDVIFLDWDSNGKADRMGIVIGTDDKYIYTVEGDVGDEVRILKYELTSTVIKGIYEINY